MDSVRFFSQKRLSSYKDENEHKDNFLLIQKITPNLGIIEIVTRNIVASLLNFEDNQFISKQTFGFWAKTLDEEKIHNKIVNLDRLEFKKYSQFNKLATIFLVTISIIPKFGVIFCINKKLSLCSFSSL
jgi:hypothetical protein